MRYDAEWPEFGDLGPMSVANARILAILGASDARKWPKLAVLGIGALIGIHTGPGLPDDERRACHSHNARRQHCRVLIHFRLFLALQSAPRLNRAWFVAFLVPN
jgi:hypothetical protein